MTIKFKVESSLQIKSITYASDSHKWNITMTGNDWPWMMKVAKPRVKCRDCGTTNIYVHSNYLKGGKRYTCLNLECKTETFIVK